jgi:hypothetical protein
VTHTAFKSRQRGVMQVSEQVGGHTAQILNVISVAQERRSRQSVVRCQKRGGGERGVPHKTVGYGGEIEANELVRLRAVSARLLHAW